MLVIDRSQLPAPESEVRAELDSYLSAMLAHSTTVGQPAPFPKYEILRSLKPGFVVIEDTQDNTVGIWEQIKAKREACQKGGVPIIVDEHIRWFHSDDPSRIQHLSLLMMGENIPPNLMWKTMNKHTETNDQFVVITPSIVTQIFHAIASHDIAVFAIAEQHRIQMESSPDPDNYDFSAGWPETYEEWLIKKLNVPPAQEETTP